MAKKLREALLEDENLKKEFGDMLKETLERQMKEEFIPFAKENGITVGEEEMKKNFTEYLLSGKLREGLLKSAEEK